MSHNPTPEEMKKIKEIYGELHEVSNPIQNQLLAMAQEKLAKEKAAKKATPKQSILLQWQSQGVPCYYARFQQMVPPGKDKEPVSEFYLQSERNKYVVESITYTPHGVIWKAFGELDITPLANVLLARFINA